MRQIRNFHEIFIGMLLIISFSSNAQSNKKGIDYSKLPLSGFFFPDNNLNKATYTNIDDKGNVMSGMIWNRYYLNGKQQLANIQDSKQLAKKYVAEVINEYLVNSRITFSTLQSLLITEESIQIIGEKPLISIMPNQERKHTKSVVILAKPVSKNISSEWRRVEEDNEVITSVASFMDYNFKGDIIPAIKVRETRFLRGTDRSNTMEYYYLYGYGLMASATYNKISKKLVLFDKMSNLIHENKLAEEKEVANRVTHNSIEAPKEEENNFDKETKLNSAEALNEDEVFTHVEQQPEFVGGMAALGKYIQLNLKYPAAAQKAGISGRIIVSFVVSKDGVIQDVQIVKSLGYGLDEEAIRVVNSMPKWIPAKQSGRRVNAKFTCPINFSLD